MYRSAMANIFVLVLLMLQACSGGNGTSSSGTAASEAGAVSVSITDAPAYGFDHVWITVKDIWFHAEGNAGPENPAWRKFPLASPVTLDLLELSNGNISVPVWDGIELPEGTYRQIRVHLAATEDALTGSASGAGLAFNNQVNVTGDTEAYPLRVPDPRRGILLEGSFEVKKNDKLKLAIDFDAGDDVVKVEREGKTEYILKPRLAYFNLDNAGAIIGHIDTTAAGNNQTARFVFKAEQVGPNGQVHVVRRATALADGTGKFVLYPLAPGTYDIVMRGVNYETVIVKNVPVTKGTTTQYQPTVVPAVAMTPSSSPDYGVTAMITSPTGAWVDFLQTLPGPGEVPYIVRFRHFNPLNGSFAGFPVASGPLHVGTYDPSTITFSSVTPLEGSGGYKAVAGAPLHEHSVPLMVTASTATISFGNLGVAHPAIARTVSGMISIATTSAPGSLDRGVLFACHGGMIVNAIRVDSQLASGGTYTMILPGGSSAQPLPGAFYGIEAFGWQSTDRLKRAVSVPVFADLSTADAADVDLTMVMLP